MKAALFAPKVLHSSLTASTPKTEGHRTQYFSAAFPVVMASLTYSVSCDADENSSKDERATDIFNAAA